MPTHPHHGVVVVEPHTATKRVSGRGPNPSVPGRTNGAMRKSMMKSSQISMMKKNIRHSNGDCIYDADKGGGTAPSSAGTNSALSTTKQKQQLNDGVTNTVVVTRPLLESMRSVSILSMSDPVDRPPPRNSKRESMSILCSAAVSSQRMENANYRTRPPVDSNKSISSKNIPQKGFINVLREAVIAGDDDVERAKTSTNDIISQSIARSGERENKNTVSGTKSVNNSNLRRQSVPSGNRSSKLGSRCWYDPLQQYRHQHHRVEEGALENEASPLQDQDGKPDGGDDGGGSGGISIVVTDTADLRMRKVSMLSMSDPFDDPTRDHLEEESKSKRTSKSPNEGVCDNSKRTIDHANKRWDLNESLSLKEWNIANDERRTTTMMNLDHTTIVKPGDDVEDQSNSPGNKSTKCNDQSLSPLPALLPSKSTDFGCFLSGVLPQETVRRQRARSFDNDECLVEVEMKLPCKDTVGNEKSVQAHHQLQGLTGEESNSSQGDDLDGTRHITRNGMEVRGVIVVSVRKKQLMRKISALGQEDPVFGDIPDDMNPLHASIIFADMDFADVPEDMRDLLTLASDKTDVVEINGFILEEESPPCKSTESKTTAPLSSSTTRSVDSSDLPSTTLPMLGLDPRKSPILEESSASLSGVPCPRNSATKPPMIHSINQHGRVLKRFLSPLPTISSSNDCIQPSSSPTTPISQYPPTLGSFNYRKSSIKRTNPNSPVSALHYDEALASQIDAMFQKSTTSFNVGSIPGKHNNDDDAIASQIDAMFQKSTTSFNVGSIPGKHFNDDEEALVSQIDAMLQKSTMTTSSNFMSTPRKHTIKNDESLAAQIDAMFLSQNTTTNSKMIQCNPTPTSSLNDPFNGPNRTTDIGSTDTNNNIKLNQRDSFPVLRREWSAAYVPHGPPSGRNAAVATSTHRGTTTTISSSSYSNNNYDNDNKLKSASVQKCSDPLMSEVPHRTLPSIESIFPCSSGVEKGQHQHQHQHRPSEGPTTPPLPPAKYGGRKWKSSFGFLNMSKNK
jgi:hypothetical protein